MGDCAHHAETAALLYLLLRRPDEHFGNLLLWYTLPQPVLWHTTQA